MYPDVLKHLLSESIVMDLAVQQVVRGSGTLSGSHDVL